MRYAGVSVIFAIGDVHGCVDELRLLLNRLPRTSETTLVFLGDYVDRGPASREVIDTILELQQRYKVVALKGNHEVMFQNYLRDPESAAAGAFIYNGGSATLASYADANGEVTISEAHRKFLNTRPLIYEGEHNVFVHAGLPRIPLAEIDPRRDEATLLWTRGRFLTTNYDWGKVVVHGHTPVARVTLRPNRINLDTGCVFDGRLSAIALPGETRFSVKRQHMPQRVVLRDPAGIREAYRFTGTIPVRVRRGDQVMDFVTVDYSELGMYLRAIDPTSNGRFHEGERIEGIVGPDGPSPVAIVGIIVREHVNDRGIHYGVKLLDSTPIDPLVVAADPALADDSIVSMIDTSLADGSIVDAPLVDAPPADE